MQSQTGGPRSGRKVREGEGVSNRGTYSWESPQPEAGGSGTALPIKTAPHRERVLEATCEILACVHALCLQTMHQMGSVQELD